MMERTVTERTSLASEDSTSRTFDATDDQIAAAARIGYFAALKKQRILSGFLATPGVVR
jgi:hypothetical protein